MLKIWLHGLSESETSLEVLGNLTSSCALAALTAFAVTLIAGAWLIRTFRRRGVIEDTSQPDHAGLNAIQAKKKDVPTMGGLMIIAGIIVTLALWADIRNAYVQLSLFCLLALGVLGFMDDYIKLTRKRSRGLRKRTKLAFQFALGAAIGWMILAHTRGQEYGTRFYVPFTSGLSFDMGMWYVIWASFVIAASSNAVNLADGLDGLAGGCVALAAAGLLALGCFVAQPGSGNYLALPQVLGAAQLCIIAASVVGAMLGFLWYNCHPAQVFMGDTGALALGGLLGFVALALKLDLLLFLIGLILFVDLATVALQIVSFKLTRRRIFPITPIHHYFQTHLRWPEQKIAVRLWIVAALALAVSFAVLRFG